MERLLKVRHALCAKGIQGLALDIDETLSGTNRAWFRQMQLCFGNPECLSVEELVTKYRYAEKVPYWQGKEVDKWIYEHLKSDSFQEELPVIEQSQETVWEINRMIPISLYLTIRPESVLNGTKKWLKKNNFPEAEVIAKPDCIPFEEGLPWKAKMLEFLYPEIIGIVDDNPGLPNSLSPTYQGRIYLYSNSDHPKKGPQIIPCLTWKEILVQIKKSLF